MLKHSSKKIKGFTLVELMVAISIIGILSAIVYANFGEARKAARDDIRKTDLKNLQLAVELYKAQNGVYPSPGCGSSFQYAGKGPHPAWGCEAEEYIVGLVPDFIAELPEDPVFEYENGKGYIYYSNGTDYKILSHDAVEKQFVTSYDDDFARCSSDQGFTSCGALPASNQYAVYSAGAAGW